MLTLWIESKWLILVGVHPLTRIVLYGCNVKLELGPFWNLELFLVSFFVDSFEIDVFHRDVHGAERERWVNAHCFHEARVHKLEVDSSQVHGHFVSSEIFSEEFFNFPEALLLNSGVTHDVVHTRKDT